MLIDTHTHLYLEQFKPNIKEVLNRAAAAEVGHLCFPNIDKNSFKDVMELVTVNPEKHHAMVGLHPCSVQQNYKEELLFLREQLEENPKNFVAVGEIGIDLYWDKSTLDLQIDAFKTQINWAKEFDLPIVIHARNSFNEIFEVLEELKDEKLKGIFHCFTGGKRHAKKAIELGFLLGIGGIVTFDQGLPNVIKKVGLEHLVLETDAPYLAPRPHKGEQNESSYVKYIAQKIADDRAVSFEEVAKATTANAKRIFNL